MNYKASIGVELEFLLCVSKNNNNPLTIPEMFQSSKGKPLVLPDPDVRQRGRLVEEKLRDTIARVVAKHRGTRVIKSNDEVLADEQSFHLQSYQDWSVGWDGSVRTPNKFYLQDGMLDYIWHAVEISSPALWVTEDSWEEIRAVVQAIVDEYWVFTPPSAGMHFHYGNGKDFIPFRKLRRMAALFIAVEPIIVQLHPPHRRDNTYCISNRIFAQATHGKSVADVAAEIGATFVEAEPETRSKRRSNSAPRPTCSRAPALQVPFKRGELTGYEFDKYELTNDWFVAASQESPKRPAAIPGVVEKILQSRNAPTVAELMRATLRINDRPAYNFGAYGHKHYRKLVRLNGQVCFERQWKRTVEFRQMAATMVPEEVLAHGKIIVRLCEFAAEAHMTTFWKTVFDCATAEDHSDWFDVFDLLAELGLTAEANVLVDSIVRFRADPNSDASLMEEGSL